MKKAIKQYLEHDRQEPLILPTAILVRKIKESLAEETRGLSPDQSRLIWTCMRQAARELIEDSRISI